jgi:hypothetical protein
MSHPTEPHGASTDAPSELLPEELVWAAGGHASDIVLTALADGQEAIVPAPVRLHVEHCTVCTTHLGHAALLSMHVGAELAAAPRVGLVQVPSVRRPIPWFAVGSGLVVAAVGSIPALVDAHASVADVFVRDVSFLVRNTSALLRTVEQSSSIGLVLTYGTALFLVAIGLGVARTVSKPQKEASQ